MADIGPQTKAAIELCKRQGRMTGGAPPAPREINRLLTLYNAYLDLIHEREAAEQLPTGRRDAAVAEAIQRIRDWKAQHSDVDWNRSYRANVREPTRLNLFLTRNDPDTASETSVASDASERDMAEHLMVDLTTGTANYASKGDEPFQQIMLDEPHGGRCPWKGEWLKHPVGGALPHDDAYQQAARQAYEREIVPIDDYDPVFQSDTLKAWKKRDSNDLLVGVRGTVGVGDLPANSSLPFNKLGDTERYKADERSIKRLLQQYPGAQIHFASHSLGSAVARRLEDAVPTASSRGFNPAFETSAFLKPGKQERVYSGDDFLSTVGRYLPGAKHIESAVKVPDSGIKLFDPSTWRTVKHHSLDSFKPVAPKQRSKVPLGMPHAYRRQPAAYRRGLGKHRRGGVVSAEERAREALEEENDPKGQRIMAERAARAEAERKRKEEYEQAWKDAEVKDSKWYNKFANGFVNGAVGLAKNMKYVAPVLGLPSWYSKGTAALGDFLDTPEAHMTTKERRQAYEEKALAQQAAKQQAYFDRIKASREKNASTTEGGVRVRHPRNSRHRQGGKWRHDPQARTRHMLKERASFVRPTAMDPYEFRTAEGALAAERAKEIKAASLVDTTVKTPRAVTIASAINPMFL